MGFTYLEVAKLSVCGFYRLWLETTTSSCLLVLMLTEHALACNGVG